MSKHQKVTEIIMPGFVIPGQRRLTGGKNLDGGQWIEIEGQGRVNLSPRQVFDMATGMLKGLGIHLEEINEMRDTLPA